ncbi:ABC transporter ATP-binding protein [Burkholderia dolosa]|uniref:ABC transporter ATP-binding protein n=1 Tax=Burkholderia dolosa TaxID=152500 RepID=UPI001B9C132B|nr:ABC transporter ATP-binding protein [Burkholderia dolosa]MBR8456543.1 ABC transporter ATP-binding protein [Burkholderia dolosa]MDN7424333.1 ABC transporter ATP-binding protein [Burkholderia dolosa]
MLTCKNLRVSYGDIRALHGIDLNVRSGETVALIGVNGAGKSTLLRAISGLLPVEGDVEFDAIDLRGSSPERRAQIGIAHVPEGRRIFPGLTVRENLEVGAYVRRRSTGRKDDLDMVFQLFPRLKERHKQLGWSLSGGEQQMLAIGRALMGRPKMLLLDEPSLGLAPRLAQEVYERIATFRNTGMTVLLVEQNTVLALNVAARGYVLDGGRIIMTGPVDELKRDPRVRDAYLGR